MWNSINEKERILLAMTSEINKIKFLYIREIKYLLRENFMRIIFISPFFLIVLLLLSSKDKNLPFGLNIFHIFLIILLIDSEIYTNQFSNIKEEFKIYCILPVSNTNLLISKNLFSLSIILSQFLITVILFLIFGNLKIKIFINSIIYFILTIPILLSLGNIISIYFPRGFTEERKEQPFFFSILLPGFSILFSSAPYFLFSIVFNKINSLSKIIIFLSLTALNLGIYYYFLKSSIKLLCRRKCNILKKI